MRADIIVIGGGIVGAAIAHGLLKLGARVLVLDGGDRDFRAANANFGMVWAQGKGANMPEYQVLTRQSVDQWFDFSAELNDSTGIDLHYEGKGGLHFCHSEEEFEERRQMLQRMQTMLDDKEPDWEMLDRSEVAKLFPNVELGHDVTGAAFGHRDGHVNPMRLLAALQASILRKGGDFRGCSTVHSIKSNGREDFTVEFGTERESAARIVIAAGLGTKVLAAQVGLDVPLSSERGQILVTERLDPFLPLPIRMLRQTREGTVLIGSTRDNPGLDTSTTVESAVTLSVKAIQKFPELRNAKVVRQWAGLRVLTPDGYPIYAESESHPGAFVASCHSGVTLAALHATNVAQAIASGQFAATYDVFHHRRFDVSQAA